MLEHLHTYRRADWIHIQWNQFSSLVPDVTISGYLTSAGPTSVPDI